MLKLCFGFLFKTGRYAAEFLGCDHVFMNEQFDKGCDGKGRFVIGLFEIGDLAEYSKRVKLGMVHMDPPRFFFQYGIYGFFLYQSNGIFFKDI